MSIWLRFSESDMASSPSKSEESERVAREADWA